MIIGIAGPTAGGKTTIAKMLGEKLGAYRTRYSDVLAEIAREQGLDADDKATLQNIFLTERKTRGEDFVAKEMEKRVQKIENPLIVIEGNRRLVDISTLKRIAEARKDTLLLLFADAAPEVRFARYNRRLEEAGDAPISKEAFAKLEANDAEDEVDDLREIFKKEGTIIDSTLSHPEEIFELVKKLL